MSLSGKFEFTVQGRVCSGWGGGVQGSGKGFWIPDSPALSSKGITLKISSGILIFGMQGGSIDPVSTLHTPS